MSIIITRPAGGGAGPAGTNPVAATIPPLNTVACDAVPAATNNTVKWIYSLVDTVGNKVVSGEVLGQSRLGVAGTESYNWTGVVGDYKTAPHKVDVQIIGSSLSLLITNKHATHTYTVNAVRIQMPTG
jgi:hypothetical protein